MYICVYIMLSKLLERYGQEASIIIISAIVTQWTKDEDQADT